MKSILLNVNKTVGHRFKSTSTNGPRLTVPVFPWWSSIRVLTDKWKYFFDIIVGYDYLVLLIHNYSYWAATKIKKINNQKMNEHKSRVYPFDYMKHDVDVTIQCTRG